MTTFAGYEMPLSYGLGILGEHLHTRSAAGLFDVSHMGQLEIRPRGGSVEQVAEALEALVPVDILGLKPGRQRYALFIDDRGGILDDLMVANLGDRLFVVVNAACKYADIAHLQAGLPGSCELIELADRALVALQGPAAAEALAALAPESVEMRFMDVRELRVAGAACIVSRSGYTGEDGFEISVPVDQALAVAEALLARPGVRPIGLGARDSLRLEAGLCLYGSDLSPDTTPVEAALEWAIQKARRPGGARAGGYPGADIIARQLLEGAPRRRVGLLPQGRAPVRGGAPLFVAEEGGEPIGVVTSGCFGPSLNAPVAMGYLPTEQAAVGRRLFAELRGARLPVVVADTPFVPHTYKR
jgi:aminomethyltransferase